MCFVGKKLLQKPHARLIIIIIIISIIIIIIMIIIIVMHILAICKDAPSAVLRQNLAQMKGLQKTNVNKTPQSHFSRSNYKFNMEFRVSSVFRRRGGGGEQVPVSQQVPKLFTQFQQ